MGMPRMEVRTNSLKDTSWVVLLAPNGQVLMTSEMYARKGNAVRAAKTVLKHTRTILSQHDKEPVISQVEV